MSILRRLMYYFWYFQRPPWDSGITPPELLDFLKNRPAGRAIDLGCGTGTNVIYLTRQGWQVVGIDFIPAAIDQARKKARQAGIKADFRVGDVTRLEGIDGLFDFALDLGCFHSLTQKERDAYLKQLSSILASGGIWFLYAFLNTTGDSSDMGLSPADISLIQRRFNQRERRDGVDGGKRPSAYFIFEKLPPGSENLDNTD